ncbi:hypothetical protein [Mycolicibacterium tusciae]|uniref:hypothetical protein n=1 Tax=Mycolicibacterium tusciae TaxID=75922 RepID=UPI00024A1320|nr:hypothetical protein [Mycolicibacterium tusciae]
MLAIPLPIKYYLNPLLGGAEAAGFVGLVFVVARTIDAPGHHEELSEHWASVHDVTGPLIGVIWPSSSRDIKQSAIRREGSCGEGAALTGFAFTSGHDQDSLLAREFWNRAAQDPELMRVLERNRPIGIVYSQAPVSQKVLIDAWSTATADSAEYFGLEENETPCLVVLSLQEHTALVLPLGMIESIYRFLRSARMALGAAPAAIKRSRDRRNAIDESVLRNRKQLDELAASRRGRMQSLIRALNSAPLLGPGVAAEVQADLQQELSLDPPTDLVFSGCRNEESAL